MSGGFAHEAILNVQSNIECGMILGTTLGFTLALDLLVSSEYAVVTTLLIASGITLTGTLAGAYIGLRFFGSSQHDKSIIENLTNNIVDCVKQDLILTIHKTLYG